jgi:hypothetical protein
LVSLLVSIKDTFSTLALPAAHFFMTKQKWGQA